MGKLNLEDVRESAKAVKAAKGGGKFFKCQDGKNVIRLFSFESDPLGKTRLERPIRRHYKLDGANPLCEKTPAPDGRAATSCEFCDRVEEVRADEGDKVAKRLEANKKYVINVVPVMVGGNPVAAPKMTLFDCPVSVIEAVFAVMEDGGDPDAYVGVNGRDLVINYDSKADPKRMYSALFRDETASAKTSAALKKVAADLEKAVVDLDSDPHTLPAWWKEEKGIADGGGDEGDAKPAKKRAAAPAPAADADESPFADSVEGAEANADGEQAVGDADEPGGGAADGEDAGGGAPAEPADEPETPAEPEAEPTYAGDLPKGVEAFWSPKKQKFYFRLPNGTTTFDEAAALAAGKSAPAKPRAAAPAPATKPAAKAPAAKAAPAKPAAAKAGTAKKGK